MLGKLIKHEFKATGRKLLPLCAACLVLGTLANLALRMEAIHSSDALQVVSTIILILFGISILAVTVGGFVILVLRFRDNLLTDEGYLMFSLPVSPHQLLLSKIITAALWCLIFMAVVLLSGLLAVLTPQIWTGAYQELTQLPSRLHIDPRQMVQLAELAAQSLLLLWLLAAAILLLFYASLAVGYSFANHKTLLSVVFFFVFFIASQIILTLILFGGGLDFDPPSVIAGAQAALWFVTGLVAAFCGVFYLITSLALKRRLNLN